MYLKWSTRIVSLFHCCSRNNSDYIKSRKFLHAKYCSVKVRNIKINERGRDISVITQSGNKSNLAYSRVEDSTNSKSNLANARVEKSQQYKVELYKMFNQQHGLLAVIIRWIRFQGCDYIRNYVLFHIILKLIVMIYLESQDKVRQLTKNNSFRHKKQLKMITRPTGLGMIFQLFL